MSKIVKLKMWLDETESETSIEIEDGENFNQRCEDAFYDWANNVAGSWNVIEEIEQSEDE